MGRRLAAIVIAEVVGYARLLGEDEAATLAATNNLYVLSPPLHYRPPDAEHRWQTLYADRPTWGVICTTRRPDAVGRAAE